MPGSTGMEGNASTPGIHCEGGSFMSLTPVNGQQPLQYPDKTTSPAADQNGHPQAGSEQAAEQEDLVQINVPMNVPRKSLIQGPDGTAPIQNFELQFIPKGALVITENELNKFVGNAVSETRDRLVPPGKKVELDDSPAGKNVARGLAALEKTAHSASLFANFSLMGSTPGAWAGPLAMVTGPIGVVAGLNNVRKAYNMKSYFEAKKAQGEQFEKVSLTNKEGKAEIQQIPLDTLIRDSKDAVVVGAMNTIGSALIAAAGLGGGPACAIASAVVTLGAFLFAKRHAMAAKAKKIGAALAHTMTSVKNFFTGKNPQEQAAAQPTTGSAPPTGTITTQPAMTMQKPGYAQ